jgi:prenyltransferase beta subunit
MILDPKTEVANILTWLESLRVPGKNHCYRFTGNSEDVIFCSCFALFILDLFKETDKFTAQQKQSWIDYIQSFQNRQTGYFEPANYYLKDKERNSYQLTCFCLSALGILNAAPLYPLLFIEQWKTPEHIKKFLIERGCDKGLPGSGNKAMFQAVFLTYEYERTGDPQLLKKIDAWFEFHDQHQNRNGFWGKDLRSHYLYGMQNAFHQLEIYFYWKRKVPNLKKIIDITLNCQDVAGFFAPTPGGEACYDYDAIHILTTAYNMIDYNRSRIKVSLAKAAKAIASNQNPDGGFCQSKAKMENTLDFMKQIPFCLYSRLPYLWYFRSKTNIGVLLKKRHRIHTGWTKDSRTWHESNLWDTWFRSLALAQISCILNDKVSTDFNFHKTIGLGHFIGQKTHISFYVNNTFDTGK